MVSRADRTEAAARQRRPRLNRELIIDTALELARKPETSTIRIRDLGRELGVDPSAVYRHFQSKNDLMSSLVDRLSRETLDRAIATRPETWRERLRAIAEQGLAVYLEYPAIGAEGASVRTEYADVVDYILSALEEGGFAGEALVQRYALFSSYVLSFTSSIALTRVLYRDDTGEQPWARDVRSATAQTHPAASRSREAILALRDTDVYRAAVEQIIAAPPSSAALTPEP